MTTDPDANSNSIPTAGSASSAGISSLPLVGRAAGVAEQIFDELAPTANDSTEVRVVKEIFRWSTVIAGGSAWALIVLGA